MFISSCQYRSRTVLHSLLNLQQLWVLLLLTLMQTKACFFHFIMVYLLNISPDACHARLASINCFKCMNTNGWSALLFSLLSVSVPVCRVSPANEGGYSRGGRVYLLTGHLWPGKQWLGQLLHQTGALRSQGQDRAGQNGTGCLSGKPQ